MDSKEVISFTSCKINSPSIPFAIGNALCATGFGESIAGLLAESPSPLVERFVAALVILILTLINLAGVKWVVRLQFALLVVLLLGVCDFGIGSMWTRGKGNGFVGWNTTIWKQNFRPNYSDHHNWFSVFGVFFPALTGVMAGINMSGDLKNPSEDISIGTLSAVGFGFIIYLIFIVVLGGTCDRMALLKDFMIAEKVSALGFLLLSALYISSISSCLATLYGTPRVLQSIASENMVPFMRPLATGRGPNQVPFNALLVISGITLVFIAIGEINRLATLASMPFLITYGVIEYSYFALCMQFELNQRRLMKYQGTPTFNRSKVEKSNGTTSASEDSAEDDLTLPERKRRWNQEFEELLEKYNVDEIEALSRKFYSPFCNQWLSLSGFIIKFFLMFFIHWGYSLLCILICVAIWIYVGQIAPGANPGIAAEFSFFTFLNNTVSRILGRQGRSEEESRGDQFVVTPLAPSVETKSAQLNEINSDFSTRSQFHQTHTVEGINVEEK